MTATAAARAEAARLKSLSDDELLAEKIEAEQRLNRGRRSFDSGLTGLWLRPVRGSFDRAAATTDKPIGELTVPEAMDWAFVLGYAGLTGYVIGKMAGNLLDVMLGGRRH